MKQPGISRYTLAKYLISVACVLAVGLAVYIPVSVWAWRSTGTATEAVSTGPTALLKPTLAPTPRGLRTLQGSAPVPTPVPTLTSVPTPLTPESWILINVSYDEISHDEKIWFHVSYDELLTTFLEIPPIYFPDNLIAFDINPYGQNLAITGTLAGKHTSTEELSVVLGCAHCRNPYLFLYCFLPGTIHDAARRASLTATQQITVYGSQLIWFNDSDGVGEHMQLDSCSFAP